MTIHELRQAYLDFFSARGHAVLPSASILPDDDSTTLFTGSGMQPMVPYLLGQAHPRGDKLANSQICLRSQDIEEIGDNRHTTFFEMLGNWSLGAYFKDLQISWMFEFLTTVVGLDPRRLYVTVFRGLNDMRVPCDDASIALWQAQFTRLGIEANVGENSERDGMRDGERIFLFGEKKNWWSRAGVPANMPNGELGGPDSEMFWDFDPNCQYDYHAKSKWSSEPCHVNCDCGRFMEIGNNVFMEYQKIEDGFIKLPQRNVDFGGGLERLAAAKLDVADVFLTDAFKPLIDCLEKISGKMYQDAAYQRSFRIIVDHVRAVTFIMSDAKGVKPSNIGAGYIVRRLTRRAIREGKRLGISRSFFADLVTIVADIYSSIYPHLSVQLMTVQQGLTSEESKFNTTLETGLRELEKMMNHGQLTGAQAFILFSTYGFPWELTEEIANERGQSVDRQIFEAEFNKHQALSRTASAGVFKGGLADNAVETTRLHTATHLLHQALRQVLGVHVEQRGSNITAERLRFDFSHSQKVTPEELIKVEAMVNAVIQQDLVVTMKHMSVAEAKNQGVIGLFEDRYAQVGDQIKVYHVGDFSREICGGPHVVRTGELGQFKIQKEEAVAAGIRRIKATLH